MQQHKQLNCKRETAISNVVIGFGIPYNDVSIVYVIF
jgi:hypothetical protein